MILATTALNDLVADCASVLHEEEPERACSQAVRAVLGTARRAIALKFEDERDVTVVHRSPELSVFVLATPPAYWYWPHEHGMWAVTAMLVGAEDDIVYDRHEHGIVERRRFHIDEGIVAAYPEDVVHAAGNESDRVTIGLHVFGGDPFSAASLEWDPATGQSRPVDEVTARRRRAAMALD